jgi:hypothetical protein
LFQFFLILFGVSRLEVSFVSLITLWGVSIESHFARLYILKIRILGGVTRRHLESRTM